jgi:hypothetical protein
LKAHCFNLSARQGRHGRNWAETLPFSLSFRGHRLILLGADNTLGAYLEIRISTFDWKIPYTLPYLI